MPLPPMQPPRLDVAGARLLERLFEQSPSFMAMLTGPDHRFALANRNYLELVGGRTVLGRTVREALPEAVSQGYLELLDQVYATGRAYTATGALIQLRAAEGDGYVDRYLDFVYQPMLDEHGKVSGIFVDGFDVTDRHNSEQRQRALASLSETLSQLHNPEETGFAAAELLGSSLGASRVGYGTVDAVADTLHVDRDWTAPGVESLAGVTPLREYGSFIDSLKEGQFIAIGDVRLDPRTAPAAAALEGKHARSFVNFPVLEGGRLVAVLFVNHAQARDWSDDDLAFVKEVGARTRSAVERATAEAKLRSTRDALIEANRLKDEFLATLAHELRNPLAPIKNALAILARAGHDPALVARCRDLMDRQVDQMTRLIEDLLDVSRLSRGLIELKKESVDVADALTTAIETSRPLIEQRGHRLDVALPGEALFIEADPTRVTQIITNLLNNAAKFTPAGGALRVALERDGHDAVLRVADNGIGIEANMIQRIFDMFEQVERSHAHVGGGLGIGLTLVKRLVVAQGGSVSATSPGLGAGSEFTVRLPLSSPRAHRPAQPHIIGQVRPMQRHRILVADDNLEAARSLAMVLNLAGHETSVVADGQEAIEAMQHLAATAVILDIAMPRVNGLAAAARLRAMSAGRPLLLVALSGFGTEMDKARSLAAGFDAHLVKPLELDRIDALLSAAPGIDASASPQP